MTKRNTAPPEHEVRPSRVQRLIDPLWRPIEPHLNDLPSYRDTHANFLRIVVTRFREREYSPKRPAIPPENSENTIESGRACFRRTSSPICRISSRIHHLIVRRNRRR